MTSLIFGQVAQVVSQRWRRRHNLQGQGLWKSPRPRPRTELPRTGCLQVKDRKARGQGLEDTFKNTRKYKCKHCNYDFTVIQA